MEVVTAVKGSSVLLRLSLRWWVDINVEVSERRADMFSENYMVQNWLLLTESNEIWWHDERITKICYGQSSGQDHIPPEAPVDTRQTFAADLIGLDIVQVKYKPGMYWSSKALYHKQSKMLRKNWCALTCLSVYWGHITIWITTILLQILWLNYVNHVN